MFYSDLHTHTTFSDGAHSIEEMVCAAIDKKMVSIGISDHSYTAHDLRYCLRDEYPEEYLREIRRVKEKYAGRIEVYAGLEYDGYSGPAEREKYDYLIGSCHYVKAGGGYHSVDHAKVEQKAAVDAYFGGDMLAYAKAYFETYTECTLAHRPDILGHFDLAAKFGAADEDHPAYRAAALEALTACLKITPIIELNTGAIFRKVRKMQYPADFLLKEVLAQGGKVILSGDSHSTQALCHWFDEACSLLRHTGFKSIVVLKNGRFEEVGI